MKFLKALASFIVLAAVLIGIPAALIALAGNPVPSWSELQGFMTAPDVGGLFLVHTLLPIIAWIAWATFAVAILLELPAQIRGVKAPRIPVLGVQQRMAGALIAAIVVVFVGAGTLGGPALAAVAAAPSHTVSAAPTAAAPTAAAPADAAPVTIQTPQQAAPAEHERTIVHGDTLWDIAEQELGSGTKYTEIFDASKDVLQPGGRHLDNPNLILPGWTIEIPTASAPVAPAAPAAPAPATPSNSSSTSSSSTSDAGSGAAGAAGQHVGVDQVGQGDSVTSPSGAGGSAEHTTKPTSTAAKQESADSAEESGLFSEDFLLRTAGGIGGLAAAGVLTVLGIRRLKQQRRRRPGQRVRMPEGEISTMELELRAVETPDAMAAADQALRFLAHWAQSTSAPLPALYAVRLTPDEVELFLDQGAALPAPFESKTDDHTFWAVRADQVPKLEQAPSAPYPALVTLGHDENSAHVLVDLEFLGALSITGTHSREALTALAVELATSRWAEDVQLTLVGIAEGLPDALETGRVRHVEDIDALLRNLRGQATAAEHALEQLGVDSIEEARTNGVTAESWAPEIVILGELPGEAEQRELAELVTRIPRVGIAAVTTEHLVGEWALEISSDRAAVLQPLELPMIPQLLTGSELGKILELLRVTDAEAVEPTHPATPELELEEIPTARTSELDADADGDADADADDHTVGLHDRGEPAAQPLNERDDWRATLHELLQPIATTAPAASAQATRTPQPEVDSHNDSDEISQGRPEGGSGIDAAAAPLLEEGPAEEPATASPFIRLLGPVELRGARGEEPRTAHTTKLNRSVANRATELVAFLALNPGASAEQVHEALWPNAEASGEKASSNRNTLTSRARRWLGHNDDGAPYLPMVGTEGYRLHPDVRTDWDLWRELLGTDIAQASTEQLATGLKLVAGRPFSGVSDRYYGWAEDVRAEMIAQIGDAAHELATRALRSGDASNARLAAAIGRQVDPVNETLWRDALRAEHQAGDRSGIDRVVSQLEHFLDSFEDGYEPEPETQRLITQIRGDGQGLLAAAS